MSPLRMERSAAQKASVTLLFGLTDQALAGIEKFIALNMDVARATLTEAQVAMQKALLADDQQELLALPANLIRPVGDRMLSYHRQLREIGSATQAEFAQVTEAQFEAHCRRMQALVDSLANSAPSGSEPTVGALASAITVINAFLDSLYRTTKEAVQAIEQSFCPAGNPASGKAQQSVARASRTAKEGVTRRT